MKKNYPTFLKVPWGIVLLLIIGFFGAPNKLLSQYDRVEFVFPAEDEKVFLIEGQPLVTIASLIFDDAMGSRMNGRPPDPSRVSIMSIEDSDSNPVSTAFIQGADGTYPNDSTIQAVLNQTLPPGDYTVKLLITVCLPILDDGPVVAIAAVEDDNCPEVHPEGFTCGEGTIQRCDMVTFRLCIREQVDGLPVMNTWLLALFGVSMLAMVLFSARFFLNNTQIKA